MIAKQANEYTIMELPLKKGKTLEITNQNIGIYSSKGIHFMTPVYSTRIISPVKKNKIRIQYIETDPQNPSVYQRKQMIYELDKPQFSSLQICHKILEEYEKIEALSRNEYGLLFLKPEEHIVNTYPDVHTSQGKGLLYITNLGIALETNEGIACDVPFEFMTLITDHKKNNIRIVWEEVSHKGSVGKHTFDFTLPKRVDRDLASSLAREQFSKFRTESGYAFLQMDKYYSNLSYNELYDLARNEDKQLEAYLLRHSEFTFGYYSPAFTIRDRSLIRACKLLGYDVRMITNLTDEEKEQRKSAKQYVDFYDKVKKETKPHTDGILKIWKALPNPPKDYTKARELLRDNEEWQEHNEAILDINTRNQEILNEDEHFNKITAESLRYYDKRAMILYKEWCKNVPLQDFTDEYDDEWIMYLLDKLNTYQGHKPISDSAIDYETLKTQLNIRNRNRTTLANFSAPDYVEDKCIWNNCWYDEQHEIWYVQDDNLDEILRAKADSDLDHSQSTIGRRVWGFKPEKVAKFCGWPAIPYESSIDGNYAHRMTYSRESGQEIRRWRFKRRLFILPILKEKDINKEMEYFFGGLTYRSTEIKCCIDPSGSYDWLTPKLLKFTRENYGYGDIPLAERVRRALFKVESGICFDVQAPLEPVPIKIPERYPCKRYRTRFARALAPIDDELEEQGYGSGPAY